MTSKTQISKRFKVFISYKHIDPDESLAARLLQSLEQRGHSVFFDRKSIRPGQNWSKEIESYIKSCDYLIPLITAESANSEAVRGEIDIARIAAKENAGRPIIIPVRLNFTEQLPYALHMHLDPIQYALWTGEADTDRLLQELIDVIEGVETNLPPMPVMTKSTSDTSGPPSYAATLHSPGGGLDADDPWYVIRDTDASAAREIALRGGTIVIMGPRQMGKTSLLIRTLDIAMRLGKRCALIDFQLLGNECLADSSVFFRTFARLVCESLNLPQTIDAFWDEKMPHTVNLTSYMEKQVISADKSPLVLAIDEADVLFQADFMYDFFAMLRVWHGKRASPLNKTWKNFDLVLVSSTEPYLFIDRAQQSPFNVGNNLRLCDFSLEQVRELNFAHQSPLNATEVRQMYKLLNGQPYLTRKAFYALSMGMSAAALFSDATDSRGPFGDHLRYYLLRLTKTPDLTAALKQISLGNGCSDIKQAYRLESAGLARVEGRNKVVARCDLYAQYFRENL